MEANILTLDESIHVVESAAAKVLADPTANGISHLQNSAMVLSGCIYSDALNVGQLNPSLIVRARDAFKSGLHALLTTIALDRMSTLASASILARDRVNQCLGYLHILEHQGPAQLSAAISQEYDRILVEGEV